MSASRFLESQHELLTSDGAFQDLASPTLMRIPSLIGLLTLSLLAACATQRVEQPTEQLLDDLIQKYSEKPVQITIALPEEGKPIHVRPVLVASIEAVSEAKRICATQGGTGSERGIMKSGSPKLLQTVRCAKGATSLWYLEFDQRDDISLIAAPIKDGLLANVSLSVRRLMPTDAPEFPVLHWKGTFKDDEDEATSTVPAKLGQRFGIAHSWRFKPQDIKLLESVWRPAAPGIPDAQSKTLRTEYRRTLKLRGECVDPSSCSVTWTFDTPEELVLGTWALSLLADGVVIFSTNFEVVRP